jgi:hypothetical protein
MHIDVGEKYHPAKLKDDVESGPYRAVIIPTYITRPSHLISPLQNLIFFWA